MKRIVVLLLLTIALGSLTVWQEARAGNIGNGNGAPSGQHYTLNIIGVSNPKTTSMTDSQRHTIFVPLNGFCGIGLTQTPNWNGTYSTSDFAVLDGNCFDKGITVGSTTLTNLSAGFQLPPPDPTSTGTLQYTAFVKVTSPKGSANMQTCFFDATVATTFCNTGMMLDLSKANYPKFVNVSKNLLTVCAFVNSKWQLEPLFFNSTAQYWWEYDNTGLQHAQFRFYPNTKDNSPYVNLACTASVK